MLSHLPPQRVATTPRSIQITWRSSHSSAEAAIRLQLPGMGTKAAAIAAFFLSSPLGSLAPAEGFITPHPPQVAALLRGTHRHSGVAQREIGAGWAGDSVTALRCRRRRRREECRMAGPQLDGSPEPQKKPGQEGGAAVHRVIFMRHGECEWNRDNRFLGWADIGLTENGEVEARKAAHTLAEFGINVDEMFCSYLKRSIKSAWLLADEMDQAWIPIHTDWRMNEQMYGALQGLNKRATAERYGAKLTQQWRRSYDIAPPAVPGGRGYFPVGDPKYAALTEDDIPSSWCGSANTESLKDAQARSWMFWRERVVPLVKEGKTVLICGHGNVIRAMLKRLDNIPNPILKQVSIPRATPLVYDLDENLMPVDSSDSLGPLSGRFLGNPLELAEALERESLQAQLQPVGSVAVGNFAHLDGAHASPPLILGNG